MTKHDKTPLAESRSSFQSLNNILKRNIMTELPSEIQIPVRSTMGGNKTLKYR